MNARIQTSPQLSNFARSRSTRGPLPQGEQDALSRYLARIGRHPLLSADEEVGLATELRAAKQAVWVALLELPTVVALLADLPRSSFGDGDGPELVERVASVDDPKLRARLAEALVELDPDMGMADRFLAELEGDGAETSGARRLASSLARVHVANDVVRSLRERFASSNLRLVLKTAMGFRDRGVALADLVQEGNLGLMKAIDRYDHRRGCRFSTYAIWWIKNAVSRAVAYHGRTIRVPVGVRQTYRRITRASARLEVERGQRATNEDLAAMLSESVTTIARARTAMIKPLSLDAPLGDDGSQRLGDRIADEHADSFPDAMDDEAGLLRRALDTLDPREAAIVRHRFGLDDDDARSLQQVAEMHDLSRERIRQLEQRALGKLRKFMVATTGRAVRRNRAESARL